MTAHVEVMDLVAQMKAAEQAFVLATVVRTVSVTAAKAGAKAIIRPDGTIVAGWIGGGCARGAVLKAAREALADGEPRMVSVQPEDLLAELGVKPGETPRRRALCQQHVPEQGHHGHFRRAGAAASLAGHSRRQPGGDVAGHAGAPTRLSRHAGGAVGRSRRHSRRRHRWSTALRSANSTQTRRFIVVSTQGKGDEAALRAAARDRGRLSRLRRQPPQDGGAARKTDRRQASMPRRSTASRRRPASTSAPSRRRKSRCRSWRKSPSSAAAASAIPIQRDH